MTANASSTTVFIGLGSNLGNSRGDSPAQLKTAVSALTNHAALNGCAVSPVYSSPPLAINGQRPDQPDFHNAVLRAETTLKPLALLDFLQQQETRQGRIREQHWGARTLDLDLLLYGDQQLQLPRLSIPHPGIPLRDFVLQPLSDLNPDLNIPGMGSLSELLRHNRTTTLVKSGIDLLATG